MEEGQSVRGRGWVKFEEEEQEEAGHRTNQETPGSLEVLYIGGRQGVSVIYRSPAGHTYRQSNIESPHVQIYKESGWLAL